MFNVTVLKIKDIVKIFAGIIFLLGIIYIGKYSLKQTKEKPVISEVESKIRTISQNNMLQCIDTIMPVISQTDNEETKQELQDKSKKNEQTKSNLLHGILKKQISTIEGMEKIEEKQTEIAKTKEDISQEETEKTEETKLAETGLNTQVITNNPIQENFNVQYGKVKIRNQTETPLTQEMLTPDIKIENKNIVLFHTHSCESYTSSEKYQYNPTGSYRTTDLNFTVVRVGTELENQLKQYNYNVVHSKDYHDYPSYNGSYTRSLATVENILKTTPSDIIIDVHRDAVGSRNDYAPTVKIGDEEAAQIMFVVGTNVGGLWHPNWNQNLKFAIKIQEKAEEMYPGLFKPIMLTPSRYNQHTGKYASIIEVGATGNTLDQCLNSMKYLAKIMNEVCQ